MRKKVCIYSVVGCLLAGGFHIFANGAAPMRAGKYPTEVKKKGTEKGKSEGEKEQKKPYGDEKPFNEVVKEMDVIKGLFTFYRKAEENKTPYIGYFYTPQWFMSEVPLVKVNLPKYTPGCDKNPQKVDCDYPVYNLNTVISKDFAESGSPALDLVKRFKWTNDDQNLVAKYIAEDGMDPNEAADKWIAANQDKVDSWLGK